MTMATGPRKENLWRNNVLPVVTTADEKAEPRHSGSFGSRQSDWWHTFEASRQQRRVGYEDAELERTEAQRVRDDIFRDLMKTLHSDFLEEERRRVGDFEDQEQRIAADYQKHESYRERDFAAAEQRREDHFREVFNAGIQADRWHAELRRNLYSEREGEVEGELVKLELMMNDKFDTLRQELLQRLDRLNDQRSRANEPVTRPIIDRDIHSHLKHTHTVSPVIITTPLPDENELGLDAPAPTRLSPRALAVDTRSPAAPNFNIPFPAMDPVSPVILSERSRRSPTPSMPHGSINFRSRASSPSSRSEMQDSTTDTFPPAAGSAGGATPRERLQHMLDLQDQQSSEDLACFDNHFKAAETRRNATEAERSDFFSTTLKERRAWFNDLEQERSSRSADAEYNRAHQEVNRTNAFSRSQSSRLTRTVMAQARAEHEHQAEKAGHISKLVNKQMRIIRLAEVHRTVITQLRLRVRDLQNGTQQAPPNGHVRVRPRGPTLAPQAPRLPIPQPAPAPTTETVDRRSHDGPLEIIVRERSSGSRQWNRHSHLRYRLSFFQPDAVEFVPLSLFTRLPAIHNALPILLPSSAGITITPTQFDHQQEEFRPREAEQNGTKGWKRLFGSIGRRKPAATDFLLVAAADFQAAQRRHDRAFQEAEKARRVVYDRAEQRRAVEFAQTATRRVDEAAMATADRAYKFDDGQKARMTAARVAEEQRRAAAAEWASRRDQIFASDVMRADEQWKQHTVAVHSDFVESARALAEELGDWQREVMLEYSLEMPSAVPPPLQ